MNAGISFYICSFFYIVLLVIIYFSKERLESNENKIYSWLIIATVIGISLEITSTIFNLHISGFETFKMILLRLLNVYFLTWIFIFFIYTYYISKKSNKMNFSLPIIIYILLALITFCLPINLKISDGVLKYTYGPSVDFVYLISGVLILGCIISMFKNFKNIKTKKYIPLLVFIVIGVMIAGVQMIFPDLLLMSSMQTFVTFLMYFTIENPDLQMVR